MKETNQLNNLVLIGLETAEFLTNRYNDTLIYEKTARFLYNNLQSIIDQLRFYVIDNQRENLKEEVIYNEIGWRPGYDLIPFYQLPDEITKDKDIFRSKDNNHHYLLIPLLSSNQIIGLMEFRTKDELSNKLLTKIKKMALAISLGLSSIIFKSDIIRIKENTDISIEFNRQLQSIDDLKTLVTTFMGIIMEKFRFDRVTTFLINDDKEVIYGEGINERGEVYLVEDFPELPDLSEEFIPLDNTLGYWFPLRANTGVVGVVLFDNIYTLHPFSDLLLDSLRILCSQFANSIDNIRLFYDLQQSAFYDSLTGLHNRTYLDKVLPQFRVEECLPLSVIVGDVNGLKVTNDVFGHVAGDDILKKIADILRKSCSKEDVVIRWGGDEFFIFLPGKDKIVTNKLCKDIKKACLGEDNSKIKLSISLGSATKEDLQDDIESVMKKAEDRMYRHKLLETKSFRSSLMKSLKETLVEKCYETAGHAERMSNLSTVVGSDLGLIGTELDDLKVLAMLHDIGKVAIDDSILNKAGPLNEEEWREIKKHSEAGYRIAQASFELSQIASYILYHHERWDGKGYPLGKKGSEIPLLSRIITVIDAYDVMTHDRPYKKAISHQSAIEELQRCAGKQFDPKVVDVFCNVNF